MTFREYWSRPFKIKYYQLKCIIIVTMLSTLLLVNIWDRFRSDAVSFSWFKYSVGLNFESTVVQNPLNSQTPRGTSKGKIKRVIELSVEVYRSRGMKIGSTEENLKPVTLPLGADETELYTGTIPNQTFSGQQDEEGKIIIKQTRPYPMNLLGIYPKVETTEGR